MEKKSTFRIKEMRNGRHLTQEELGEIIGVSQQTFSRYEKQEVLMPVDVLVRLSRYFNVSTDYLLGLTDVKRNLNQQVTVEKTIDEYYNFIEVYKRLNERDRALIWKIMNDMKGLDKWDEAGKKDENGSV